MNGDRLVNKKNDLDNLSKPVLDSLKRSGLIVDDSDIFHLEASKFPTNSEEEVHISIKEWNWIGVYIYWNFLCDASDNNPYGWNFLLDGKETNCKQ